MHTIQSAPAPCPLVPAGLKNAQVSQRCPAALSVLVAAAGLAACGGGGRSDPPAPPPPPPAPTALACDDTMKTAYKPDANTTVLLVKQFRSGDPLLLSGTPTPTTPTAGSDLCFVKLQVGPGNPGPASAPSTSAGIGIEVWLPAPDVYSKRIHNLGGGGWAGGNHLSLTAFGSVGAAATAANEKAVVGTTDTGHSQGNGTWAMNADGSINTPLWNDFVNRGLTELAVKTKSLAQAFYLQSHTYAYWEGCSTGGRQGYAVAQNAPSEYDGYLNGAPAQHWTRLTGSQLHGQVAVQRDLGGVPLTGAQLTLVSAAAVSACDVVGGQHLGLILDQNQCKYDPLRDASVLCAGAQGRDGVVGANGTAACVSPAQAQVISKTWYGHTPDGSVPDPMVDNGLSANLQPNQLWYGFVRGTNLAAMLGTNPFSIGPEQVALNFQNPAYASPSFVNATGSGQNLWRTLTYAQAADSAAQGLALQPFFGNLNTEKADLSGVRDAGSKIISYHGTQDTLIPAQGTVNYYTRVANAAGGFSEAQKFNKMYLIPGMGHCGGVGSVSGVAGPTANANSVPLPKSGQLFAALVDWVEKGVAPSAITLSSTDNSVTRPICPYPQQAQYSGSGAITSADNYACR
jgi:hypothetical protein